MKSWRSEAGISAAGWLSSARSRNQVRVFQSLSLLHGTETQIVGNIQTIEGLSVRDLPQRYWWLTFYGFPENIRNIMQAIEQYLEELETLVKDGRELHRMIEEKAMPPSQVQG